jgi:cytochrome P450
VGHPHEAYARLRHEAPVFWFEPKGETRGFWAITKHADIVSISSDAERFSSYELFLRRQGSNRVYEGTRTMLDEDPPRHIRLRRLISRGFTPRQIGRLEAHIREIVADILDEALPREGGDFVDDIAGKLPLAVICELMGLPRADWHKILEWSNHSVGSDDPEFQAANEGARETAERARAEQADYVRGLIRDRKAHPGDDLISTIVQGDIEGERLTETEILGFCFILFLAGNETTRNAAAGGALAFLEYPDQWARLKSEPDLAPSAVEEILRWTTPVTHFCRLAKEEVEIRGKRIAQGEQVALWYGSANRDEDVFPDPFRFDVGRAPNEHLTFGVGEHYCLGASLARLELRILFEALAHRVEKWELTGPVARLRATQVAGLKHVPMRWKGQ